MVKQFMRRHSQADPMYAGLPVIPARAQPKLRLWARPFKPKTMKRRAIRAPAVRACASQSAWTRDSRMKNRKLLPLLCRSYGSPCSARPCR